MLSRTFVIRRAVLVHGLELALELEFALPCCLNLCSTCSQLGLLFLCLGQSRLLSLLLLFLPQFALLHLFLKSLQASFGVSLLLSKLVLVFFNLRSGNLLANVQAVD
jgi:hypothetical protein